jgi:hypothetical protein
MNKHIKVIEYAENNQLQLTTADGFDDCTIGVGERCGHPDIMAYDSKKIIRKLIKQGMDKEEALEYFDFNILGACMGDTTPIFIVT